MVESEIVPNLFLIGAPRSGTTSMYLYLKQHPEIYLSILKEPHFYSTDLMRQPHTIFDKTEYMGLFSHSNKPITGEGSVWYLISRDAPKNIYKSSPEAKIIVMLRRPWEQLQSLHSLYLRTNNEIEGDLERALLLEETRRMGQCIPATSYFVDGLQYRKNAVYFDNLNRYIDTFGDDVKVIIFDDFVNDPAGVMSKVFTFLGVSPHADLEYEKNRAQRKVRNLVLKQLRNQPRAVLDKFHKNYGAVHETVSKSPMSATLKDKLKTYFYEDVNAVGSLINRDLIGLWYGH